MQRINLGCNREGTLSASHNVVLIPADDESALPICFRAREETRPCPCCGRIVPSAWLSLREITDPLRTSSLNLALSCRSIRRHESYAKPAIEFRTGAPTSIFSYRARYCTRRSSAHRRHQAILGLVLAGLAAETDRTWNLLCDSYALASICTARSSIRLANWMIPV